MTHLFSDNGAESLIKVLHQVDDNIEDRNQVAVLGNNLLLSEFSRASKKLSYKEAKDKVVNRFKSEPEMYCLIKTATVSKPALRKESIKFFMIKHELFFLIYLYYKFLNK